MKPTTSNNRLHSLIWNIIIYFAIVFFGETICGGFAGLMLEPSAFVEYGVFPVIELFIIIASYILFYQSDISSILNGSSLSCFLLEPLLAFLLPILSTLREFAYIRRKLRVSIISAITYVVVYFVFTYLLIDLGWTTDGVLLAHVLAAIMAVCILLISLLKSDPPLQFVPLYMRLWELNSEKDTVIGNKDFGISETSKYIPEDASVKWLEREQQHFVEFTDSEGIPNQMWQEDIDSLSAKMQIVPEYHLPGVAFWLESYSNAEINAALAQEMDKILVE